MMQARQTLVSLLSLIALSRAQQCNNVQGVMFQGFDYQYLLVGSAGACCTACTSSNYCAGYTYTPGRCWLKTALVGAPTPVTGAVSGSAGRANDTCPLGMLPCPGSKACSMFGNWCTGSPCTAGSVICPDGFTCSSSGWAGCPNLPAYLNTSSPIADRANSIVAAMSVAEIAPQLDNRGYGNGYVGVPAVEHLGIPAYDWLNEGLHGDARSGIATSMPQISVMGPSWNRTSWYLLGRVLSIEARAKYAMYRRTNDTDPYSGLTFYAPNINIFRDPRWGRGQEVPGEDPFLTGQYAVSVVSGAQAPVDAATPGSPPSIVACCKHLAAYSLEQSQSGDRSHFNAIVSGNDLLVTYLPAFQSCLRDAKGASIMCSYNAINGVPTCASNFLLDVTSRQRYGFNGFIVSDYGAVEDASSAHHYCSGSRAADNCTAICLKSGVDQDGGGSSYYNIPNIVSEGLLTAADVQQAGSRLFAARLSLGLLDVPESQVAVNATDELDTDSHRQMALEAAQQGIVLLSNGGADGQGTVKLPLSAAAMAAGGGGIAIVGPNADNAGVLVGNYNGTAPFIITLRQGIQRALQPLGGTVQYALGCNVACTNTNGFAAAVAAVNAAGVHAAVIVLGIDQSQEAEGLDRTTIALPGNQNALFTQVAAAARAKGIPVIVALVNGGPVDASLELANADAVVLVGYASQSAGDAFADVLFGDYAPAGKLTVTWPKSVNDLPSFSDMSMTTAPGRTYKYTSRVPLFPFGHGLSYTTWTYSNLAVIGPGSNACNGAKVSVTLTNAGTVDSTEVVQVYVNFTTAPYSAPQLALVEFDRVFVAAKGSVQLSFTLPPRAYAIVNASAAATFGQNMAVPPEQVSRYASGAAFGLGRDFSAEAAKAGVGPIGWEDMWVVPGGSTVRVFVGSGQPGFGAPGVAGQFAVPGQVINLASCAV